MSFLDKFSLAGKKALITSASDVYGAEIAVGLAKAGAEVFLAGADVEALKGVADRMQAAGVEAKGIFEYHRGTEEAAQALTQTVKEKMGALDILVENSSNDRLEGWAHSFEEIYQSLAVTQKGLILTVKNLGAYMAEQGHGSVIYVSDYAALVGCDVHNYVDCPEEMKKDFGVNYGYVKGSFVNYARQTAGYLGAHNCRANCIAYGPLAGTRPEAFEKAIIRHSQLKRLANADDVAAAAVFFASDASEFITGTTLAVDGGYTAK